MKKPQRSEFQAASTFCSDCGNELSAGSRFCNQCGTEVYIKESPGS
ncbi:MAG: hypothetical protein DMG96_24680 [Acidobacteria bacterium]|nr:MAG: hypothetical protein DMG96_24680 [Acidobacteriota bacterium]